MPKVGRQKWDRDQTKQEGQKIIVDLLFYKQGCHESVVFPYKLPVFEN